MEDRRFNASHESQEDYCKECEGFYCNVILEDGKICADRIELGKYVQIVLSLEKEK